MRKTLVAAAATMICLFQPGLAAQPQDPAPGQAAEQETLGYNPDAVQRMTVPVSVNGQGPFRFVVDTGAERTVLSRELATSLGLAGSRDVTLTSMTDVRLVPTVLVSRIGVGRRSIHQVQAPILAQRNLGAQGLLGADSLQNLRIDLDFEKGEMYISHLRIPQGTRFDGSMIVRGGDGTIVVTGRTLLGRMILTDAMVDGERVLVVVDTGSAVTIGNEALRARLARREAHRSLQPIEVTSVTGATMMMDYTRTGRVRVGGAELVNLPIAFADVRLFRELHLQDRPALLLGMDALQQFRRVSIDFATRRLRLVPGPSSFNAMPIRMARAAP
jgi:predicted aspartyl protease